MKKNYIAYEGKEFIIEWYHDASGKSLVLEYYEKLPKQQKGKLERLLEILGDTGKIRTEEKFRYEGNQIFALKPKPDRFLCFFYQGRKVIITNAFEKKQDKMPIREKDKALKFKTDYIERNIKGIYYD